MTDVLSRWREGLSRTGKAAFGRVASLLGATEINENTWDELETILIQADLGIETTTLVIDSLKRTTREQGLIRAGELKLALRSELRSRLDDPPEVVFPAHPTIILLVGVNGSGKTTTAAKLGERFLAQGKSLLFGAADTFRAAAVDQLQIWADRLNIPVVAGASGSDPGAVAFNTIQSALSRGVDVVLIDTAGRLQTRFNLMEELRKVHRVVGKAMPGAPHEVWLVLDATTGQNAMEQARRFNAAVGLTGIILAKLDTSARGGMAFSIQRELGVPILFAGLGERSSDLTPFDPESFIDGILQD